jgi:hypothetical protein
LVYLWSNFPLFFQRELRKNSGVWIERDKLKDLIAQSECSVGDKPNTLFKKLMKHMMGEKEFTTVKPSKIEPSLFSAVMGMFFSIIKTVTPRYGKVAIRAFAACSDLPKLYELHRNSLT